MFGVVPAAIQAERAGSSTTSPARERRNRIARSASIRVGHRLLGLEVLDERDPLFEGLDDLFVVEPIGRRLLHRAAVDDRDAAPLAAEARRSPALRRRARARSRSSPHLRSVVEKSVQGLPLLAVEDRSHGRFALFGHERLVAAQRLLDEQRVIGEQLRRRVDGGQAAADRPTPAARPGDSRAPRP